MCERYRYPDVLPDGRGCFGRAERRDLGLGVVRGQGCKGLAAFDERTISGERFEGGGSPTR